MTSLIIKITGAGCIAILVYCLVIPHHSAATASASSPAVNTPSDTNSTWHLSIAASRLQWKAGYTKGGGHEGTILVTEGTLLVSDDHLIKGGNFAVDMNSIFTTDQKDGKGNKDLEDHLKSNDFFSIIRFPKSYFTISAASISSSHIQGKLTIKGISIPISFPANVLFYKDSIRAKAVFPIDGSQWNIIQPSPNPVFGADDNSISKYIQLSINLLFKRQKEGC